MLFFPRSKTMAVGVAVCAIMCLDACDGMEYLDGTPPPDQKLTVSNVVVDSTGDSATGRTVRLRFRSSWEIDSVEFSRSCFWFGLEFSKGSSQWTSSIRTMWLTSPRGSRLDTLWCTSTACYYQRWPVVHILTQIPDGMFLSVADDSVKLVAAVGQ